MYKERVAAGDLADDILTTVGDVKAGSAVKGCWKVVRSADASAVIVRNLFWPGYSCVYDLSTGATTGAYMGNGSKNMDVPFML